MKKLSIDTSNQTLAIAVTDGTKLLGQIQTTVNKNHSTALMPAIEFLMQSIQLTPSDLEQIVVAEGPGSYTGLRIGVTTAKTLASTLAIPLIAVSSLKVLAANSSDKESYIIPVFDARRQNVYAGVYRWEEDQLVTVLPDSHQSFLDLVETVKDFESVLFIGQDMAKFEDVVADHLSNARINHREQCNYPSGLVLAQLSEHADSVNVTTFAPEYLKKVEAEEKWLETNTVGDGIYVEKI